MILSVTVEGRQARLASLAHLIMKLSSDRKNDFDFTSTALHPEGAFLLGTLFMDMILDNCYNSGKIVNGVAGMTLGADPLLVSAVSVFAHIIQTHMPGIIIRKQAKGHGTNQFLEGTANFLPGDNIVILKDVVTTGNTLLKALQHIKDWGLNVMAVMTVLDRQEGGRENLAEHGFDLQSIFTVKQLQSYKK